MRPGHRSDRLWLFTLSGLTLILAGLATYATWSVLHDSMYLEAVQERRHLGTTLAVYVASTALVVALGIVSRVHARQIARARVQGELDQLRRAAYTDVLTGLANDRAFRESLLRAVEQQDEQRPPVALALIDIDELKVINDTRGQERGDAVIVEVAELLRAECRSGERCYRLQGGLFALILRQDDGPSVFARLETLRALVATQFANVTVSIGVSAPVAGTADPSELREQADAALHTAKRRGRNMAVLYHGRAVTRRVFSEVKVQALRRMLAESRMEAAYQPIWDLAGERVIAYEGLARPPQTYGLYGPQEAFDIADRIGKSYELDELCRATLCGGAAGLPEETLLFVNVSPITLMHQAFSAGALAEHARSRGVDPRRIVVEFTERTRVPVSVLRAQGARLRSAGFRLALDDVGAGNSGLEILRSVPMDYVKIDHSVTQGALINPASRAVLMAILAFAGEVGMRVVVEGVETEAMLALVRSLGAPERESKIAIHGVQGFLLGRPQARATSDALLLSEAA